jgi:hypothetical protein
MKIPLRERHFRAARAPVNVSIAPAVVVTAPERSVPTRTSGPVCPLSWRLLAWFLQRNVEFDVQLHRRGCHRLLTARRGPA